MVFWASWLTLILAPAWAGNIPAVSGAVQVHTPSAVRRDEAPMLTLVAPARDAVFYLECPSESPKKPPFTHTSDLTPAGQQARIALPVQPPANRITCVLVANFANGLAERREVVAQWEWVDPPKPDAP